LQKEGGLIAQASNVDELRVNEAIRARTVRLIGPDGNQLGVRSRDEALAEAKRHDMDLVEVAPQADPPVCRIMDFGKYKFDVNHKARESRRKSASQEVKEVKYRPKIGSGDFDTKTKQLRRFLEQGHKVKVTIMFRGREVNYPELGQKILDMVAEKLADVSRVERAASLDGRNMIMVLAPDHQRKSELVTAEKKPAG